MRKTAIENLLLPGRTEKLLRLNGFNYVEEFVCFTWEELCSLDGLGPKPMADIARMLTIYDIELPQHAIKHQYKKEVYKMAKKNKQDKRTSFREMAKRRSGVVRRLGKGETVEVRFMFEMDDADHGWQYLVSHYDEDTRRSYFYEDEGDLPEGVKNPRESFFALAYDVESDIVHVWELRKTMVVELIEYEEEYGSITDRNYKLKRRGEDINTKYTATPMDKCDMTKKVVKARGNVGTHLSDALESLLSLT